MRGIHLYAALLGSIMVTVAIFYVFYTNHMEHEKIKYILELDERAKVIPYIDIIREESFAATSVIFRKAFENLINNYIIYVPKEVFDKDSFDKWINEVWLKNDKVAEYVANLLTSELRSYMAITDVEATVMGQKEALKEAIKEGVEIRFEDNAFYVIFDPSRLSKDVLQSLPGLEVCKEGLCRRITVFPDEKTEITVPLRWKLAFEKARNVVEKLDDIETFAAGYCKKDCPVCGVYRVKGDFSVELVYPKREKPCEPVKVDLLGEDKGPYRAVSSSEGGCLGIGLEYNLGKVYGLFECGKEDRLGALLLLYYNDWFKKKLGDTEVNIFFPSDFLTSEPTYYVLQALVYDASEVLEGSVGFGIGKIVEFLSKPRKLRDVLFAPGTACRVVSDVKCVYPRKLGIGLAWEDKDVSFSVSGIPVTYRFVAVYGDEGDGWLAPLKGQRDSLAHEIKKVREAMVSEEAKLNMCQESLENKCREKDKLIEDVCHTTDESKISVMRARLYELEQRKDLNREELMELDSLSKCIDTYDNLTKLCNNVEAVCSGEITLKIRDCGAKALKGCWEMLSMLDQGKFRTEEDQTQSQQEQNTKEDSLWSKISGAISWASEKIKEAAKKIYDTAKKHLDDPCGLVGTLDTPPLSIKAAVNFDSGCRIMAVGPTGVLAMARELIGMVQGSKNYELGFLSIFGSGAYAIELLDGLYPKTSESVICRAFQITDLGDICRAVRVYNKYINGELEDLTEEENKVLRQLLDENGPCFKPKCQSISATPAIGCNLSGVLYSTIHVNPATSAYRIGCYVG